MTKIDVRKHALVALFIAAYSLVYFATSFMRISDEHVKSLSWIPFFYAPIAENYELMQRFGSQESASHTVILRLLAAPYAIIFGVFCFTFTDRAISIFDNKLGSLMLSFVAICLLISLPYALYSVFFDADAVNILDRGGPHATGNLLEYWFLRVMLLPWFAMAAAAALGALILRFLRLPK